MNFTKISLAFCIILFITPTLDAQTKKIKRPKSRVGVTSVDNFVQESFDLYDKVYKYDGYAASGKSLDDDDIDVLEEALDEMSSLSDSAPDIVNDLDGVGVLKQGKATLQINKAKKALKYSIKTAKELLLGQRERDSEDEDDWYYHEFEPLYQKVNIFKDWDYDGKDPAIYGYGGKRYLEGKKSMMGLYSWYEKRGFTENQYLNTHYKYFDATPLPAMEFLLGKWSIKTICLSFLDNKKIEE